jgi:hypothetical protein
MQSAFCQLTTTRGRYETSRISARYLERGNTGGAMPPSSPPLPPVREAVKAAAASTSTSTEMSTVAVEVEVAEWAEEEEGAEVGRGPPCPPLRERPVPRRPAAATVEGGAEVGAQGRREGPRGSLYKRKRGGSSGGRGRGLPSHVVGWE